VVRAKNGRRYGAPQIRLSNSISGAPYKSPDTTFTHGDYPEQAVNLLGTAFVIWGEADGSSI